MRWRRTISTLVLGGVAVAATMVMLQPAEPFTSEEMALRVAALWRYGAVDVPTQLAKTDDPAADLMAKVAAGQILDAAQSSTYRRAIQSVLAEHQTLFALLDNNLCLVQDAGADEANNVGSTGIAGLHDLHAASAASNFAEMQADLAELASAGSLRRIYLANEAYKDLTDLMVHLAPATHSVVVGETPALPAEADPALTQSFETFRNEMLKAGFTPVNSPEYLASVAKAQVAYTALALMVQDRVTTRLTPLEQKIAGRWLAVQGVQPRLVLP